MTSEGIRRTEVVGDLRASPQRWWLMVLLVVGIFSYAFLIGRRAAVKTGAAESVATSQA